MTLHTYPDLVQGTDEWLAARLGMVTASVVGQLVTVSPAPAISVACPECRAEAGSPCISQARKEPVPIKTTHGSRVAPADAPPTIVAADNDTSRSLTTLLVAERITGWTDPVYVSDDMMRGTLDEPVARAKYAEHYAPVDELGFMVREEDEWRLGYSPDGLVGDDGLIEIKSRRPKKHVATILADAVPAENMAQLQAGLLVTGRAWCDYVSFAGGLPLWTKRVYPDEQWFTAIIAAATRFETTAAEMVATYTAAVAGRPATERTTYLQEAGL